VKKQGREEERKAPRPSGSQLSENGHSKIGKAKHRWAGGERKGRPKKTLDRKRKPGGGEDTDGGNFDVHL